MRRLRTTAIIAAVFLSLAILWARAADTGDPRNGPPHQLTHSCPSDPDILFTIAGTCTQSLRGNKSCRARSPRRDYVIIKDNSPQKPKGYLLIPVSCVTGVEDPSALRQPISKFWKSAWIWSRRELPAQPASRLGLAVNSLGTRGNDQLHIHLSCVAREVRHTLDENAANIPEYAEGAIPLRVPLGAHRNLYAVVKVRALAGTTNPFAVVENAHGGRQSEMAKQGIAVVAAKRTGEYYVLNTDEDDGGGHAEEILDQRCK